MGFHGDSGHGVVGVNGAHRVAERFVLLGDRGVGLVVGLAAAALVEQVFRQSDETFARAGAILFIDHAGEAEQCLFDALVAIAPCLFGSRADVAVPAIGEAHGSIEHARVLAAGELIVGDAGFDEISADVSFVVGFDFPARRLFALFVNIGEGETGLHVAVLFLGSQQERASIHPAFCAGRPGT